MTTLFALAIVTITAWSNYRFFRWLWRVKRETWPARIPGCVLWLDASQGGASLPNLVPIARRTWRAALALGGVLALLDVALVAQLVAVMVSQ
jgi:hypothetical protein